MRWRHHSVRLGQSMDPRFLCSLNGMIVYNGSAKKQLLHRIIIHRWGHVLYIKEIWLGLSVIISSRFERFLSLNGIQFISKWPQGLSGGLIDVVHVRRWLHHILTVSAFHTFCTRPTTIRFLKTSNMASELSNDDPQVPRSAHSYDC